MSFPIARPYLGAAANAPLLQLQAPFRFLCAALKDCASRATTKKQPPRGSSRPTLRPLTCQIYNCTDKDDEPTDELPLLPQVGAGVDSSMKGIEGRGCLHCDV